MKRYYLHRFDGMSGDGDISANDSVEHVDSESDVQEVAFATKELCKAYVQKLCLEEVRLMFLCYVITSYGHDVQNSNFSTKKSCSQRLSLMCKSGDDCTWFVNFRYSKKSRDWPVSVIIFAVLAPFRTDKFLRCRTRNWSIPVTSTVLVVGRTMRCP
jgi:hypothetical protein